MKRIVLIFSFLCSVCMLKAQIKVPDVDKSPLDMSYCPAGYPILKINGKAKVAPVARVIYSRSMKSNRQIFGGIVKYNAMWRLGANEATEIQFFRDVKIAGKKVIKGTYTMYCIPQENKWTIIFNKDLNTWGDFTYDIKKDVARADVAVQKLTESVEAFSMYFEDGTNTSNLIMAWDMVKVSLPISY